MSCFFMIDVYIDGERGRGMYDSYIRKVWPAPCLLPEIRSG